MQKSDFIFKIYMDGFSQVNNAGLRQPFLWQNIGKKKPKKHHLIVYPIKTASECHSATRGDTEYAIRRMDVAVLCASFELWIVTARRFVLSKLKRRNDWICLIGISSLLLSTISVCPRWFTSPGATATDIHSLTGRCFLGRSNCYHCCCCCFYGSFSWIPSSSLIKSSQPRTRFQQLRVLKLRRPRRG